jgi:hypothetical protein
MINVTPAQLLEAQAKLPDPTSWPRMFIDVPVTHCCFGTRFVRWRARLQGKLGWIWALDDNHSVIVSHDSCQP